MAAHTQYPPPGAEPLVRGDPTAIVVRFQHEGVDQDITTWTFRSFVRDRLDGTVIGECEDFAIAAPDDMPDLFPGSPSSVPSVVVANWNADQTQMWETGFVADLESLTPIKHTWLIFDQLRIDKDVSYEPGSP